MPASSFHVHHAARRYRRINAPPRSIDTLSLKEVYAIKHETANRALNSKLLASLNSRPQMLNISAASVNNSPLISSFISSVITTRALIKDPEFRKTKSMGHQRMPHGMLLAKNALSCCHSCEAFEQCSEFKHKQKEGGRNSSSAVSSGSNGCQACQT